MRLRIKWHLGIRARAASAGDRYLRVLDWRVEVLGEQQVPEIVDGERGPPKPRGAAAVLEDPVNDPLGVLAAAGRPRGGEVAAEIVSTHVGRAGGVSGEERAHVVGRGRILEREPAREEDAAPVRPHLRRRSRRGPRAVALVPRPRRRCVGWGGARGTFFSVRHFSRREVSGWLAIRAEGREEGA